MRLHHIVSIEVIANVNGAVAGTLYRLRLKLRWPSVLVGLKLVLLLLATTLVAMIASVHILVILILIVSLMHLWLILHWPSSRFVLLLFG